MTALQFFRACRDLVRIRWMMYLKKNGVLCLIPVVDYLNEGYDSAVAPIVAVAKDRFGRRISDPHDVHYAAEALRLSKQNATLIVAASFSDAPPDKRIAEVRSEILSAVMAHRSPLLGIFLG